MSEIVEAGGEFSNASDEDIALSIYGYYKRMSAGDVRDKLLYIFEILASYRLLVKGMRLKPALEPSFENNQICWTIYTSGLKQHMPFMPVLGHFAYAKATFQEYIRWEHRIKEMKF